jgi:hypothetical protein
MLNVLFSIDQVFETSILTQEGQLHHPPPQVNLEALQFTVLAL